ncbi:hypothetical protein KAU33_08965 [Candidatus Dependentiae bacterium]|nr:hypothetical protein [Candidatus Dependentiae bacterium]
MSMKLKHIQGDIGCEIMWISKKFNNGDWDYWLVLKITNLEEMMGKKCEEKYLANIDVVSPEAAGLDELRNAMDSFGMEDEEVEDEEDKVILLEEYGTSAELFSQTGNNYKNLMKEARKEMEKINTAFGFYMDKELNHIGNTGWDFVSGNFSII